MSKYQSLSPDSFSEKMSGSTPLWDPETCPNCGGLPIAVVGAAEVIGVCESCDYLWRIPQDDKDASSDYMEEGDSERALILLESGPNVAKVASLIREATGMTAPEALEAARSSKSEILRVDHHWLADLQDLHQALKAAGAKAKIQ